MAASRDKSGERANALRARFGDIVAAPMTKCEILRGAQDDPHWKRLKKFVDSWPTLEVNESDWQGAARIEMEMRRRGLTLNDPIDCCVAHAALARGLPLLHRDRDFESVRRVRKSLSLVWLG